jgi:hypothetical protein
MLYILYVILTKVNRAPSVFIQHSTPSQDGGERFDVAGFRVLLSRTLSETSLRNFTSPSRVAILQYQNRPDNITNI